MVECFLFLAQYCFQDDTVTMLLRCSFILFGSIIFLFVVKYMCTKMYYSCLSMLGFRGSKYICIVVQPTSPPITRTFLSWKTKTLCQLSNSPSLSLTLSPQPPPFWFSSIHLMTLGTSYKWNHSICPSVTGLFQLAYYYQHSPHLFILNQA